MITAILWCIKYM